MPAERTSIGERRDTEKPGSKFKLSRRSAPKARTGCQTCKGRKVKCDEGKPECNRCVAVGMKCGGYKSPPTGRQERVLQKPLLPRESPPQQSYPTPPNFGSPGIDVQPEVHTSKFVLVEMPRKEQHTDRLKSRKVPQLQTPSPERDIQAGLPDLQSVRLYRPPKTSIFDSEEEHRYFRFFSDKTVANISGIYNPVLWNTSVLQACEGERSILYAAIAIGALDLSFKTGRSSNMAKALVSVAQQDDANAHYQFSLREMNKAIKQMRETVQKRQDLRTTLLASILIIVYEIYHGNHESALEQIRSSVQLLEDWTAPYHCSLDSAGAGLSPSPHTVEDDLVHAFYRLEIEGMVYIDKLPIASHLSRRNDRTSAMNKMPAEFDRLSEAQVFGKIQMRRTIHFLMVAWTFDPGALEPDKNMYVLDKIRCNATLQGLEEQEGYRIELARWYAAFTPLLERATSSGKTHDRYAAICLQVHYLCTCVAMDCVFRESEMFFDTQKPIFTSMLSLIKILLNRKDDSFFVFDSQVIIPLEFVARKCRDPVVRREALKYLVQVRRKEGFMDSDVMGKICSWLMEIEEEGMVGCFIPGEARATDVLSEPGEEEGTLRVCCTVGKIGGHRGEVEVRHTIIR